MLILDSKKKSMTLVLKSGYLWRYYNSFIHWFIYVKDDQESEEKDQSLLSILSTCNTGAYLQAVVNVVSERRWAYAVAQAWTFGLHIPKKQNKINIRPRIAQVASSNPEKV